MSANEATEERPLPYGRMVVVKFKEGMEVSLENDALSTSAADEDEGVEKVLENYPNVAVNRLFSRSKEALDADREAAAEADVSVPDFNLFYRLDLPEGEDAAALAEELRALPGVEMAYVEPEYTEATRIPSKMTEEMTAPSPVAEGMRAPATWRPRPTLRPPAPMVAGCSAPTPDFSTDQDYLQPAPTGMDVLYAWTQSGGMGQNTKFADIEFGWLLSHEDLTSAAGAAVFGTNNDSDHGTNVLGEVIGAHNGRGVRGIAPQATVGVLCSITTKSVADCINHAASVLGPGDVILIELQTDFKPVEIVEANYVAIQAAVAAGVVVVEAAGNGATDLDSYSRPATSGGGEHILRRNVRDSGAIMVGAGCPPSGNLGPDRSRWMYSNYGSRLDVQGQAREVCTTGDGALFDCGPNRRYNDDFQNTSAASPQVVGAVLILEGISQQKDGTVLTPAQVRQVLVNNGTPQQDGDYGPATQQIGPRPNLKAAINQLWPSLTPIPCPVAPIMYRCPPAPIEFLCPPAPIVHRCPPAPIEVRCPPAPFILQCPPAPHVLQCPPAPIEIQCPPAPIEVQCPPGPIQGPIPRRPRPTPVRPGWSRRPAYASPYGEYASRGWRGAQARQPYYYGYAPGAQAAGYPPYGYGYYGAGYPAYPPTGAYGYQPGYAAYGYAQVPQAASYAAYDYAYGYPYGGASAYQPGYYEYGGNPSQGHQPTSSADAPPEGAFRPEVERA